MIDIEESRFYCFGCGAHGSTLELISFYEPELSTIKKMILAHRYLRDSGKQEKLRVYIYNNIYNNNILEITINDYSFEKVLLNYYKNITNNLVKKKEDKIISLIKETDKNLSNIIKLSVIDVFKDNYNDLTKKVYLNKMDNLN